MSKKMKFLFLIIQKCCNTKKMKTIDILEKINVSKHLAHHLVGNDHTLRHRRIIGGVIAISGVSLDFLPVTGFAHFLLVFFGYSFHAVGLIPFLSGLENVETKIKNNESNKKRTRHIRKISHVAHKH